MRSTMTRRYGRKRSSDLAPARPDSFFMIDLAAVTPNEIVPHLEHPFFGLSKIPYRKDGCVLRYENDRGEYLELQGDPRYGLPTVFDQDFFIYAVSVIRAEREKLENQPHAGGLRRIEEGVITFSAAEFAEFTQRTDPRTGRLPGSRYDQIEAAINRLVRTNIATNISSAGYTRTDMFGMVDAASVVRRRNLKAAHEEGALVACRIELSKWIMSAIDGNHLLRLDRGYFRLRRPLDRRLYQIVRKHCGRQPRWEIGLPKLYAKSGSRESVAHFRHRFRDFAERWSRAGEEEDRSLLGYRPEYDADRDTAVFTRVRERLGSLEATGQALALPSDPDGDQVEIIRAEMPGYDPYWIYREWLRFTLDSDVRIRKPNAALRGFCRERARKMPRLDI